MSKKPRGHFELSHEELSGTEMVFTAFSILESRGYPGFTELLSILNDPEIVMKIIRLLYGTTIKVPTLEEFSKCLQAAIYTYCDMHKHINRSLPAKGKDIRQFMNIDEAEEAELLRIFDEWAAYMCKQGYDPRSYLHMNRTNTKKRIELASKGKKWTKKVY